MFTGMLVRTAARPLLRVGLVATLLAGCLLSAAASELLAHDPSRIVAIGDRFHVFFTGRGGRSASSTDLTNWVAGPAVFKQPPAWTTNAVPANKGDLWAPDVIELDGRLLLYYSVSTWGRNTSAIGLATAPAVTTADQSLDWRDEGLVIQSSTNDDFNAIDPAPMLDAENRLWLAFGSFWSGIKLVELDRTTGRPLASGGLVYSLAAHDKIEAPYIHRHDDWYYLFVNWGQCCRGTNSTYNLRVGRSQTVTGPYLDRDGRDLRDRGGSLVLETDGRFIGPGHAGIITHANRDWLSFHFYNGSRNGKGTLAVRRLRWDAAGWPVVAPE